MKAGVDAPEPALEQGGEGSGVASGSGVAGFVSAPVGRWAASHMPVDTAQNSANAMTSMRRSSRPGSLIWLSSSPKPRLLKSENMASSRHQQRQLAPLRLTLARQALLQVRRDGLGQLLDPTHSRRSAHPGALNHTPSPHATKLTHGKRHGPYHP